MIVTFLVAIDVLDLSSLLATADDISDDLLASGHDVQSVKPWARPSDPTNQPAGGFFSLEGPTPP